MRVQISNLNGGRMKLIKYRVTNFRSVKDSGDIDAGDVAALIGVNESGKPEGYLR